MTRSTAEAQSNEAAFPGLVLLDSGSGRVIVLLLNMVYVGSDVHGSV